MDELRHGFEDDAAPDELSHDEEHEDQDWGRLVDRVAAYAPDSESDSSLPAEPPSFEFDLAPGPELPVSEPEPVAHEAPPEYESALEHEYAVQSEAVEPEPPVHEAEPEPYVADEAPAEPPLDEVEQAELAELLDEPAVDDPAPATIAPGPSETERRRRMSFKRSGEKASRPPKPTKSSKRGDKRPRKLVGLKIGASQIAAARIVNNGAPELVEVVREPLEPGVVVAGEIRDADALAVSLKRFFDVHKLPKKGVRLGLSNNRVGVRVFEIEDVTDDRQLENAIRFRAEEVLPIPLEQAVLDYVVLGDESREDGTTVKRILLVVAYREVVDRYLEACRAAGLDVVGIDLEAFALLRSLAAPSDPVAGGGALVAVAVGHDRTTIAVSNGRLCEFARVLDWGGWSLNVAIARELDLAPSEVEQVKRQLSLAGETAVEGLSPEQVAKVRAGVDRAIAAFSRELVSSLHFYQAQRGALGIGEIVLTGGTAHMDGLPEALARLVGVPVRVGDPFKRVKVSGDVSDDHQRGSLAVAIGLGIED